MRTYIQCTNTNNEDPFPAFLALRNTPGKDRLSPAQKFMGGTLRTTVPSVKHHLKTTNPAKISKKTTVQYDSKVRNLNDLHPGDRVRLRAAGNWSMKGKVMARDKNSRSYHVKTQTGNVLRRNRPHLLKTNGTQSPSKLAPPIQSQATKTSFRYYLKRHSDFFPFHSLWAHHKASTISLKFLFNPLKSETSPLDEKNRLQLAW